MSEQQQAKRMRVSLDTLIEKMVDNKLNTLFTALPARVLKFYPETMRADVQPLICTTNLNGQDIENSPTTNVPVVFPNTKDLYIRCPLVEGDLVLVQYSTVALDEILTGEIPKKPQSKRRFSQKDGMVLGGYRFDGGLETLSGEAETLVIHRRSTNTIIKFDTSGSILITGANAINAQCKTLSVEAANSAKVSTQTASIEAASTTIKSNTVAIEAATTTVSGNMTVNGTLTGGKMLTAGGKDMDTHTHKYNPGPGGPTDTAPPS